LTGLSHGLFSPLPDEARKTLARLPRLINETFPLPTRFRTALPHDVADLSRLLTSGRKERGASYLGRPALLSAYLRYFLPWNIFRLCRLFCALPLELKPGDAVNDLGAGPLTLAASLWISRPDLRSFPLEFRCLDKTAAVLEAGKKFFIALAPNSLWTVRTICGELRTRSSLSVEIRGKPAALSAAVNVYNELFWNLSPLDEDGLNHFAESHARLLSSITDNAGSVLVVEPGIPRSGEFISLLRHFLAEEGRFPISPCTHSGTCPLPGGLGKSRSENHAKTRAAVKARATIKARWCHFAFDTEDAPKELHSLSAAARIPKERAVLSFILAGPLPSVGNSKASHDKASHTAAANPEKIRVISDCFPVGENSSAGKPRRENTWGRYGCSKRGLVLVTGSRRNIEAAHSGALEELTFTSGAVDAKSGAFIANKS